MLVTNHAWKVKGGYDTDSYDVAELDENKNIVARYKLYDSTKTSPPFDREIYSEKIITNCLSVIRNAWHFAMRCVWCLRLYAAA